MSSGCVRGTQREELRSCNGRNCGQRSHSQVSSQAEVVGRGGDCIFCCGSKLSRSRSRKCSAVACVDASAFLGAQQYHPVGTHHLPACTHQLVGTQPVVYTCSSNAHASCVHMRLKRTRSTRRHGRSLDLVCVALLVLGLLSKALSSHEPAAQNVANLGTYTPNPCEAEQMASPAFSSVMSLPRVFYGSVMDGGPFGFWQPTSKEHPAKVILRNLAIGACNGKYLAEMLADKLLIIQSSRFYIQLQGSLTADQEVSNGTCSIDKYEKKADCTRRYSTDFFNTLADDRSLSTKTYNGSSQLPAMLNARCAP